MPSLKLRLGSKCNQNCKFCHSNRGDEYTFNKKLIPFIKYNDIDTVTFSGGEPLMYWDTIKMIINEVPNINFTIVSNGSLFNGEILEYCIKYNMTFAVSLNEYTNIDDDTWKLIGKIPRLMTAKLYDGTKTFEELDKYVEKFQVKTGRPIKTYWYNLMHTIKNNSNISYTKEAKEHYISEMKVRLRDALYSLVINRETKWSCLLGYLRKFLLSRHTQGCNTYDHMTVSLDGRFMDCSYISEYDISIDDLYNYKIPRLKKEECYECQLVKRCHTCYKTLNNDQCEIYNDLYSYVADTCKEFNIHNLIN